ncbi:transposase [Geobacter sulfurreducens]|nr:transposase [Geobacter sulfurreducens]AJY70931.1 transposase [Geobacter sulfurreducens]AJY71049.1 transposase [Geobacter sulfurreducens]AJY71575.1 transposase [Geobacter sulfurreducens]AJY71606.1 transposase [Geobacter sulfurreducens]
MKRFTIEQSDEEFYTSHSGISLPGLALNRFTSISSALAKAVPSDDVISHADCVKSYCGLLAQAKSDFVAIEQFRADDFFRDALGNKHVPSEGTMRQRMDEHAEAFLPVLSWASIELLQKVKVPITAIETGHVTVDIDGFAMDNSDSKKENVSRTYRQFDGYLFLPAYIGIEGWMVNGRLLPGSQHPQKEFIPFLRETQARIRQFCDKKLLYRKDSAHDSLDTLVELAGYAKTDYIIKWNPRKQNNAYWWRLGLETGAVSNPRPGKRVALFSVKEKTTITDENGLAKTFTFRRVMRVTERTIDKKGQPLLIPDIELEGWWTSLKLADEKIIELYKGHGLCEQYHAEIKTDMDLERLPSGKFATNQLVMACGALMYNILRFVGQTALVSNKGIIRHEAKRRRIKTVIQEMIYFAGRMIVTGRRLKLRFSRHATAHAEAFARMYNLLAYG